jgi:hypothetical protein
MATTTCIVWPIVGLVEMASRLATFNFVHSSRYQLVSRPGISNNVAEDSTVLIVYIVTSI